MDAIKTFIYEFTNVSPFQLVSTIIFSTILIVSTLLKINKQIKNSTPQIVNIEVIDNKAQWVYDSKIYYADIIDGKIDNSTMKRIEI